ncbi:MAG TPA: bifunctional diguanylate cyclase/phosphodiesterase [Mycobacteriales bacterium]|jgi:diguanylate cyclase (GGDEF)-like protein|nr:bifunctional diguanylate cyclase/phosphodiesterase [Mycobacteriales bacterium]
MTGDAAEPAPAPHRGGPALDVIVAGVVLSASAVCLAAVILAPHASYGPNAPALALAATLSFLAFRWRVPVRIRSHSVTHVWGDTAFLLSVALVPEPVVVVAAAVGVLASYATRGVAWQKSAFNVGMAVLAGAAGLAAALLIAPGGPDARTPRGLVALAVCGLVYALCCELLTDLVLTAAQGVPFRTVALGNLRLDQLVLVGNLTVGVGVAAAMAHHTAAAVLLLPLMVGGLRRVHASAVRMREHEQAFRDLEGATESLARLDGRLVLESLVVGAARLCRAELVEVVLADGTVVRGTKDGIEPAAGITHLSHMTTAALAAGGQHLGEVRLRFAAEIPLTEAERRALSTLATVGGVAIANARQHERTRHDATHDSLTELPNRRALMEAAETALAGDGGEVALFVVDLDRFKEVNDTLGHSSGDALLCAVAGRLRDGLPEGLVARLGGDEFAMLLPTSTPARVSSVADRMRAVVGTPVRLDVGGASEVAVTVLGSVGVATAAGADGVTALEMLRRADVAMYRAKSAGSGIAHYDAAADPMSLQRLLLEPELRAAVDDPAQIVVEYQPQLDFGTGAPVGAEALVRWRHPVYGLLYPDVVIPAVERCGLDRALTLVVLDRAVGARAYWAEQYGVDVRIAVNVAPRTMLDRTFPEAVHEILRRHRTAPDRLVVEVPETVAVSDLDAVADVLGGLHRLGVQVALDDFGTGGAPLTLLARMPVDEVKIDRSFVAEMAHSGTAEAIVRATVDLARGLGLRTVAEGVETASVDAALRDLGCDAGQGYRYERPVDRDAAGASMRDAMRDADTRSSAGVVRLAAVRRRSRL